PPETPEASAVHQILGTPLPQAKVQAVEELIRAYGAVAMIGDGVNDAPAMGRATVGVSMGAAGSYTAIEAADIALMADDLSKLPRYTWPRHARDTARRLSARPRPRARWPGSAPR